MGILKDIEAAADNIAKAVEAAGAVIVDGLDKVEKDITDGMEKIKGYFQTGFDEEVHQFSEIRCTTVSGQAMMTVDSNTPNTTEC